MWLEIDLHILIQPQAQLGEVIRKMEEQVQAIQEEQTARSIALETAQEKALQYKGQATQQLEATRQELSAMQTMLARLRAPNFTEEEQQTIETGAQAQLQVYLNECWEQGDQLEQEVEGVIKRVSE